ncbi:MAG TPA: hypothetical protein PLD20_21870 [Blastocatellia bacterium]|nr:hypothetical protein [Blastocatellia bacterium]HMZ20601.1 hypothetical protein [Blastocatellia bacterium]HNG34203.1 hypothetical protein [Blastocatellia bacterium]
MRVFRTFFNALGCVAIAGLVLLSSGCEYANKIIAKDKLNQGAILYNQGRMKEAQQFFRDALSWDDKNAVGQLFLGATLVKDYKNMSGDERTKVANEALETYKKALSLVGNQCRNRDNAISYIATIYQDLDKQDEWREWILKRGEGECGTKDIKATTYYTVAVNYWTCSYDQTTRYQDKTKATDDPFHYRNMDYPAAVEDKKKAETCAAKGLEYIEKALSVDPEYVEAMFYKGLLYRQQQMLTKEEPKHKELGDMAKKISDEAVELQKKKEAAAEAKKAEEAKPKA